MQSGKEQPTQAGAMWTAFVEAEVELRRGGEGGIRTHGDLAASPHFECGALVHYATSPRSLSLPEYCQYTLLMVLYETMQNQFVN